MTSRQPFVNLTVFIACFTICHTQLLLYRALDNLKERCLYSDMNFIIFVKTLQDLPLKPLLGSFWATLSMNSIQETKVGKVGCRVR